MKFWQFLFTIVLSHTVAVLVGHEVDVLLGILSGVLTVFSMTFLFAIAALRQEGEQ